MTVLHREQAAPVEPAVRARARPDPHRHHRDRKALACRAAPRDGFHLPLGILRQGLRSRLLDADQRAWINGGAPSQGFLNSDAVVGPLKPFFAAIASPASDVLFMVAMLAIGVAVMLGIGLRVSAVVGGVLMVAMYLAEWPFGANAASNNPLVDYHIIYALALIVVAVLAAGDTWGFGRQWKAIPAVQRNRWLV